MQISSKCNKHGFMLHDLYTCVSYHPHVCMGVCESPWTGRPPPQRLHPWSTGCVLQAWPHASHRSGCTESRPSAGAPGFHPPPGPQVGLEERHKQIHAFKKKKTHLSSVSAHSCVQTSPCMCVFTHKILSNLEIEERLFFYF